MFSSSSVGVHLLNLTYSKVPCVKVTFIHNWNNRGEFVSWCLFASVKCEPKTFWAKTPPENNQMFLIWPIGCWIAPVLHHKKLFLWFMHHIVGCVSASFLIVQHGNWSHSCPTVWLFLNWWCYWHVTVWRRWTAGHSKVWIQKVRDVFVKVTFLSEISSDLDLETACDVQADPRVFPMLI